jgi:integrase
MPSTVYPKGDRWVGRVAYPVQKYVGTFDTPEEAREAVARAKVMMLVEGAQRPKPKPKRPKPRMVLPTEEQVLLLASGAGRLEEFVLVAAFCGARLFEVAALEVRDVRGPRLRIRHGKGDKARDVVLFEPARSALARVLPASGLVFRNDRGEAWSRKTVNQRWRKLAKETEGCQHIQFRDLRRFHATWLLDQGLSDLDTAVQLGHFDRMGRPNPELVREVYGHPSRRAALDRLATRATS